MKTLKYLGLFLVFTLSIISCESGENPEREAKLEAAGKLHDEGLVLGRQVKDMLEDANQVLSQIEAEMPNMDEALKKEAEIHINSISDIKDDYDAWQKGLVEVPGHAHEHHEGEHHHHDHSMDNASPDEILKKQEELKEYIEHTYNSMLNAMQSLQAVFDSVKK